MKVRGDYKLGVAMAALLLLLGGVILFCFHLGKTDLGTDAAALMAANARQMNERGDWLLPIYQTGPRLETPPLYLWAVKLMAGLRPEIDAFRTRLPAAICAVGLMLLVAAWTLRHVLGYARDDEATAPPEGFALLAGLMLGSSPLLFLAGRAGTPETMYTLLYVGAAFCWAESLEARRSFYAGRPWRVWVLWGYALAGLAMLANGPLVLLPLWAAYLLAARSYRLGRPDWIHLPGLALALLIGALWLLLAARHPQVDRNWWRDWLLLGRMAPSRDDISLGGIVGRLLVFTLPWCLLGAAMTVRVWRKLERSPTRVFWMWSLLANLVLLPLLHRRSGGLMLPALPFVVLLAVDGLYRWNFESRPWARVWRLAMRGLLILGIALGIFFALLLSSDLGLTLFIISGVGWMLWAVHSRASGWIFTPWETAVRLAGIGVLLLVNVQTMLLADWEPRREYYQDRIAFFRRARERLLNDAPTYVYGPQSQPLHDYYINPPPARVADVGSARSSAGLASYLFARGELKSLAIDPRLVWVTGGDWNDEPGMSDAVFELRPGPAPAAQDSPTSNSSVSDARLFSAERLRRLPPFRMALLGNSGTRSEDQRDVAKRLRTRAEGDPLDSVVLLGNNLFGPSIFDHLNYDAAFLIPYNKLLQDGIVFYAALGHEDQSYAWVQRHFPPFHMRGERYYQRTLGGGLVDLFVLDSERKGETYRMAPAQMDWLQRALASSRAPWKVVALHRALSSSAANGRPDKELAETLMPIFDRYQVDLVAWAGGPWYERIQFADHRPTFFNGGWSGEDKSAEFRPTPDLKGSLDGEAGLIWLEFTAERASFEAITEHGRVVDSGTLTREAGG